MTQQAPDRRSHSLAQGWPRVLTPGERLVPRIAALAAALAGAAVLAGWTFDVEILKSFFPGLVAMNPVSAVAFIILGVALWFSVLPPTIPRRLVVRVCGGVVALIGAVKVCEIVLGSQGGIDTWLFPDAVEVIKDAGRRNRMAPNTAVNFLLLGWATSYLDPRTRPVYLLSQVFQLAPALTSLFAVIGYLYGISSLYGARDFNPMPVHTAAAFLGLGVGFCFARPDRGLASLMRDEGVGGITARRLLPAALFIPAGLGWLRLQGQQWGLYESELGIALHVVVNILVFSVLVWWSAVLLKRVDAVRLERASELSSVNGLLQEQIAERSRMQEVLKESTRREGAMIENSIDMICTIDATGRFATVSPASYKLLGYRSEELLGQAYIDLVLPDDVEKTRQEVAEVMAGREAVGFENGCRCRDGRTVHLVWTAHWSGSEQLMFCVARDNTERKRAEARLQEARDYFDRIINSVPDPIFVKDRQHRCVLANDAFCQMVGRERTALVGKSDDELFPGPQAEVFVRMDELVFAAGQDQVNEETLGDADHQRVILTRKRLYVDNKGDQFIVGVIRDITDRKRMESELEATRDLALESVRLKAEFLATMSHEIRTPMNAVIGMSDLLFETELSESQRDYADTIRSSADALLTIINDILDFSKSEAGKLRFENIDFDLHDAIDAPVEMLANRAHVKGLELVSFVHNDVPTALRGDPGRLRQVVTNLVGNAIKFTERGEIVVCVTREAATEDQVTLRFEITDTGVGIPEEARLLLFVPFTQGEESTTRKYGGTGLGLAISKQLVGLMGGEIGVTGAPGGGSTFWFTATLETQPQALSRAQPARGTSLEGVRVLIVDDNPTNRRILTHQTASWGMAAVEAESGAEGMASLRAAARQGQPFRVAILDLDMPVMDGFQLAEAVKSDESIAGTRLVLMPAIGKRGHGEAARRAGIAAYLEKPVRQSQLHACLVAVLGDAAAPEPVESGLVTRHSLREVAAVPGPGPAASSLRILVADDLAVNRTVASIQLRRLGHQADCVANGTQAIAALAARDYDLVLMDCQMPEMDGFQATQEIRRREGVRRHTTIIAMTASALAGDREKCLAAGMDDYITKPVKAEALRHMLDRWLEREIEGVPAS